MISVEKKLSSLIHLILALKFGEDLEETVLLQALGLERNG